MTRIKLCGMRRVIDIQTANALKVEFIGFVFWPKSKRKVTPEEAAELKSILNPDTAAVGVFVDEKAETVAELLNSGTIDIAQLHGSEDEAYIRHLRTLTRKPLIQAFRIREQKDLEAAARSSAESVLLDAGKGDGITFDWNLLKDFARPYFLAGGLTPENVSDAIAQLHPYAVDISSGIETNGIKDAEKMTAFVKAVRKENL